jgi:hypothetical protein
MVAGTDNNIPVIIGWSDNNYSGFCPGAIYLCYILSFMAIKIKIEKKKKRIPVPKKPPKVEKDKTAYDRKREKDRMRKHKNNDK